MNDQKYVLCKLFISSLLSTHMLDIFKTSTGTCHTGLILGIIDSYSKLST